MSNRNRDLATSMPESWDLYIEAANRAAEATKEAFDKIRETARIALEEQEKFNEGLKKTATADDEHTDKLERATKALDAHARQQATLLKIAEEGELRQTATPEERAKIREKHQNATREIEDAAAERRLILVRDTIDQLDKDIAANNAKRQGLKEEIAQKVESARESKEPPDTVGIARLNEQVASLEATIAGLARKRTRYNSRLQTDSEAAYIGIETHEMERAERALQPGDDTIASGVAASFAARARLISEQQKQAFADLAELYTAVFGSTAHLTQAMQYSLQHHLNQQQEIQLIKNQIQALLQSHR